MKKYDCTAEKSDFDFSLIENFQELKENMDTIDSYLESGSQYRREYALQLIRRGICFVAIKADDGYRFYPSRFLGYKSNTQEKHSANDRKDGRITNPRICNILHTDKPVPDEKLNLEYIKYCSKLGFEPGNTGSYGVTRKFWEIDEKLFDNKN